MKRVFVLALLLSLAITSVFAADFTVQTVNGRVEREAGNQRVAVQVGDVLKSDTVIITGVGSTVVLLDRNGKTVNVRAAQNGKVADLTRSGISISGNVTRTDTTAAVRITSQTTTASARASDVAADLDIAAE